MISIPDYEIIEKIRSGPGFTRLTARHINSPQPIVCHFFPLPHAIMAGGEAVSKAYDALPQIRSHHVMAVHAVQKIAEGPETGILLIMAPAPAESLSAFITQTDLSLVDRLDIAIQLSAAVNDMHRAGFIHKGLTLEGIAVDPDDQTIKVSDFAPPALMGSPSRLFHDPNMPGANLPEHHLAYISPEQTGRMNRQVDFRTDFYSLGIILFILFTESLPFAPAGPEKLIHDHVAKQPLPPDQLQPEISDPISEIIMKLLAKDPEDRYQSAYGLQADLACCYQQLAEAGRMESAFTCGNNDAPEVLILPDRLFGRDGLMQRLKVEYQRVQRADAAMVLIAGAAGMGKTRLMKDFAAFVTGMGGYFLEGRCEPLEQKIPYSPVIQAFSDMIRHILTQPPDAVATWRRRIEQALGNNARLIVDVIPELAYIIGQPEAVSDLSPADALNRFNITFENFFRAFAAEAHPLVVFIDDMQWADAATLHQMEVFFTEGASRYILFTGAYRHTEIRQTHPLPQTIEAIRRKNVRLTEMALDPITEADIAEMITASLKKTMADAASLAGPVHQQTGGNPDSARQLLARLYAEGLLVFDFEKGAWKWGLESIRSRAMAYSPGDALDEDIKNLPAHTLAVLKLAACIGERFDLAVLARIAEKDAIDAAFDLWPAVEAGFITGARDSDQPLRDLLIRYLPPRLTEAEEAGAAAENIRLMFRHNNVRQIVYAMLPADQKEALHLKIGRHLLAALADDELPHHIYQVINHFNRGAVQIKDEERLRLARLNLMAGQKAVGSHAYTQALEYFSTGAAALSESAWQSHYSLMFALVKGQMTCEYFTQDFDAAEERFQVLMARTVSDTDRAEMYTLKMIMLASLARHDEALEMGLAGLRLLDVRLPSAAGRLSVLKNMLTTQFKVKRYRTHDLLNLPQINDRRLLLVMNLLANLCFSAFLCSPYVAIVASLKAIDLTLKQGNSTASPFGYMIYGASLCAIFKNYAIGRKFGDLALTTNERFGTPALVPKLLLLYGAGISIWTEHLHKGLDIHRRGVKTALETGDTNYAVYHIQSVLIVLIASGAPLDTVSAECERYFNFVKNSGDTGALNYLWSVRYYLHGLRGEAADAPEAAAFEFDEARHVAKMEEDGIQIILLRHFLLKLRLFYTMGNIKGALTAAKAGEKLLHYHMGTLIVPEFHFFHALVLAAACPAGKHPRRPLFRRKIKGFLGRLYALSRQCPENFEHKYLLAAAEYERISGRDRAAMAFYHQAGRSARENGFIQFHALANELTAKFYKGLQLDDIARNCLTLARDGYRKWGAHEKVRALENAFPEIPAGKLPDKTLPAFDTLDFSAVIYSLQTISTDIVFEDLLKSLLPIMLENAGATKTQFLTIRSDQMYLEAEHTVNSRETRVFASVLAGSRSEFFLPVLNYVRQTGQLMVLEDACRQADYSGHPYMDKHRPRSVLCLPVRRQTRLVALLYLENRLAPAVFTPGRIDILELLASQAAISLENARLYENVRQKERALRQLNQQCEDESLQYQSQLRSLSSQLSLTEERERRRIATELHDRIGHALTNASMRLSRLRNPAVSENDAKRLTDEVHGLIEQSIQDTQTLTFELSPPILYDLGLEAAIDWLAEQTQSQHGITVNCVDDMSAKPIDESLRVLLFQAARELLFNVVKHARASQATISISREGEYLSVTIEDDGVGFNPARARHRQGRKGGFGLFSIQERLAHQGGRLEIHSEPGKGARFNLISPMKAME